MSDPQAESLFRVAETTLSDVTRVLDSIEINYEHLTRHAWGVGVGIAFFNGPPAKDDAVLLAVTVEIAGPTPSEVPHVRVSAGVMRDVSGDRQEILEACNSFNERWITPTAYVMQDPEDRSTNVLLKAVWPVMLFQHTPWYLGHVLSQFIRRTPELRGLLTGAGHSGDVYRASEDDVVDLYFHCLADPKLD